MNNKLQKLFSVCTAALLTLCVVAGAFGCTGKKPDEPSQGNNSSQGGNPSQGDSPSQGNNPTPPASDCTHADKNGDGVCDACGGNVQIKLSFFAVNDLHGKFVDTDSQPGVDELTTYIKSLYADTTREEILLSSGDMWQGTVESSSNKGALMTEWMNDLGFVSMTVGNHEFDWGPNFIETNAGNSEFDILGINVRVNGEQTSYCKPSTVVERGGIKIGIIGAIGNCLSSISGEFSGGLYFATGSELSDLVKEESTRLRTEEGCSLVVFSLHDGYGSNSSSTLKFDSTDLSYYDTELSNGYIDLVFEGHTHKAYVGVDEYGVYHLQGGGENSYISRADVDYDLINNTYKVTAKRVSNSTYAARSIKGDPIVDEIFNKYFPDENPYTTVVGTSVNGMDSYQVCDTLAELYLQVGLKTWGAQYDIYLGGGYLKTRSPYDVARGKVTVANVFSLLPFDNEIVLGSISGGKLKSQFINTSNGSYHCAYNSDFVGTVEDDKTYYIVVDTYTAFYAPNGITEVTRIHTYPRTLLCDYFRSVGTL